MCAAEGADEFSKVYVSKYIKSRIAHYCDECGRVIQKGEHYENIHHLFDGNWGVYKTCSHCFVARKWLLRECSGFLHHGVYEDLYEHTREGYKSFWIFRCLIGMNNKWTFKGKLMSIPRDPVDRDFLIG